MKIKEVIKKYREQILYLVFGTLTTAVDFAVYWLLTDVFLCNPDVSNVTAAVFAMIFAFVTNKLLVFENKSDSPITVVKQFISFAGFRLLTILANELMFHILHVRLGINDYIVKITVAVIIVISNYIFSKLVVFKKKN